MHLITIIAFAAIFWQAEQPIHWYIGGEQAATWSALIVLLQPPLFLVLALLAARRSRRLFSKHADAPQIAQTFHHRSTFALRVGILLGHLATVFLTYWPEWFAFGRITPAFQIVGDLMVLMPFALSAVAIWIGVYPIERMMHDRSTGPGDSSDDEAVWTLRHYLDFNFRHHILIVAVPMTIILLAGDLIRGYEEAIQSWSGWTWTPDVLLGTSVAAVFLFAPLMLCRIWHTTPLETGPLRDSLEAICRRIRLRHRDILIWHSDGMVINAAVMGILPSVRYVLLSDALLETMSDRQIEAVFGHEAGHVRRRHVQFFLIFAFVGWMIVTSLTELLARFAVANGPSTLISGSTIQGFGVVATILLWWIGFGWISRRFEREADLFGAECVAPAEPDCEFPCGVHPATANPGAAGKPVCATGAAVFTSALDRVALLNGIPHEERSWRHSSIGSRIRFLTSLAGDPVRAARFRRLVRGTRFALLALAVVGAASFAYYLTVVPEPAIFSLQFGPG